MTNRVLRKRCVLPRPALDALIELHDEAFPEAHTDWRDIAADPVGALAELRGYVRSLKAAEQLRRVMRDLILESGGK